MSPTKEEIHAHLIVSAHFSPVLVAALEAVGPVEMPVRTGQEFGWFLGRRIVGQQLSTKAANSIWLRVLRTAEERGEGIPEFFRPHNTRLLRRCGVSQSKIKALCAVRQAGTEGLLDVGELSLLAHEDRSTRLQSIWGVGQWTCDMASIFYFGSPDVWPMGDVSVQKAFGRLIGRRRPHAAAAKFAPFRSHLALYMWRVIDGPSEAFASRETLSTSSTPPGSAAIRSVHTGSLRQA
jgi:DNA-3-methyladenine glycosylase II